MHAASRLLTVEHLGFLGQARAKGREQASGRLILLPRLQQKPVLDAVLAVSGKHANCAEVQVSNGNSSTGSGDRDLFPISRTDDDPLVLVEVVVCMVQMMI